MTDCEHIWIDEFGTFEQDLMNNRGKLIIHDFPMQICGICGTKFVDGQTAIAEISKILYEELAEISGIDNMIVGGGG